MRSPRTIAYQGVDRVGDAVIGDFDVRLPNGELVSLSGAVTASGRVAVRGLRHILQRDVQNAAAGAVRAALADHFAAAAEAAEQASWGGLPVSTPAASPASLEEAAGAHTDTPTEEAARP